MLVINFTSTWEKKEELELTLIENDIDIFIGSETHLDPSISNSEFLHVNYTAFRKDGRDDLGGAIIIMKTDIISELLSISYSSEMLAIKILETSLSFILLENT